MIQLYKHLLYLTWINSINRPNYFPDTPEKSYSRDLESFYPILRKPSRGNLFLNPITMWQRILRIVTAGLNTYSFYANPLRYILSLLAVILIPYAAYLFWGSIVILLLTVLGICFLYRLVKRAWRGGPHS